MRTNTFKHDTCLLKPLTFFLIFDQTFDFLTRGVQGSWFDPSYEALQAAHISSGEWLSEKVLYCHVNTILSFYLPIPILRTTVVLLLPLLKECSLITHVGKERRRQCVCVCISPSIESFYGRNVMAESDPRSHNPSHGRTEEYSHAI